MTLPLCRATVGVFYSPSRQGKLYSWVAATGTRNICFWKRSINVAVYYDILIYFLILYIRDNFEHTYFIFQFDLLSPHPAKSTKEWLKKKSIPFLERPANIPDVNSIENLWGNSSSSCHATSRVSLTLSSSPLAGLQGRAHKWCTPIDPPHMVEQKQDDQLQHTYSSYVRIRDVVLKTCRRRWSIGRNGERGSGISELVERHDDDDDDDDDIYIYISSCNSYHRQKRDEFNSRRGYLQFHLAIIPLKRINPSLIARSVGSLTFVLKPVYQKENSEFNPFMLHILIDLVLHPARAEGLVL